jgi:uncharacterized protein YggE
VQTGDHRTVLSVRGDAQRVVAPDQVSIFCGVSAIANTKSEATAEVGDLLAVVASALAAEHGQVLTPETARAPLTWSTQSIRTHPEYAHNKVTGEHGPTGRHQASATMRVTVRDFALLAKVETALTRHDATDVHSVQWSVDHDNPAWALVRADAIQSALLKGQDYAAALGGSIISVDHVADAGLLGGDTSPSVERDAALSAGGGGEPDAASVEPVPQVLSAVIEARLTAVIAPLRPH